MNRTQVIASALPDCDCSRGAPMGRDRWMPEGTDPVRCLLFRVPMDSGGYDSGGAYWGTPGNVWCLTDGETLRGFTRAGSRAEAWAQLSDAYPMARLRRGLPRTRTFVIQGNYGQGWEDVTAEDNRAEARARLCEYRENEPQYPHRLIVRRERA